MGDQLERRQGRVRVLASLSDPFVRYGGGAGWADRADSAGGVPSLGCCEDFFVEHVWPHMWVARPGRRRLFPAGALRREVAVYALCTGRSER